MMSLNIQAIVLASGLFLGTPCCSAWAVIVGSYKVLARAIYTMAFLTHASINLVGLTSSPFQELDPGDELDLTQQLILPFLFPRFSSDSSF